VANTKKRRYPGPKVEGLTEAESIVRHSGLVSAIVQKYWRPGGILDREDCEQAGVIGLIQAFRNWDPARQLRFSTYASARVRGAVLDALRNALPVGAKRKASRRMVPTVQLSILNSDDNQLDPADEYGSAGPEFVDLRDEVEQLAARADYPQVIRLRFIHGWTLSRIGRSLGVSESRVSQIVRRELSHMKKVHA